MMGWRRRSWSSMARLRGGWPRWIRRTRPTRPPFSGLIDLLASIPGVSRLSALTILSEIGRDMSRFSTAGHLVAWAGLCPGQNESAGKRKRSRLRKGAPWLKAMLVQCAWAAKRTKDSYHKAQFFRLNAGRKSHLRGSRLDPHRDLSHPHGRRSSPRPRLRLFRPAQARSEGQATGCQNRQARLRSDLAAHRKQLERQKGTVMKSTP
jgi:hypothetical protein